MTGIFFVQLPAQKALSRGPIFNQFSTSSLFLRNLKWQMSTINVCKFKQFMEGNKVQKDVKYKDSRQVWITAPCIIISQTELAMPERSRTTAAQETILKADYDAFVSRFEIVKAYRTQDMPVPI